MEKKNFKKLLTRLVIVGIVIGFIALIVIRYGLVSTVKISTGGLTMALFFLGFCLLAVVIAPIVEKAMRKQKVLQDQNQIFDWVKAKFSGDYSIELKSIVEWRRMYWKGRPEFPFWILWASCDERRGDAHQHWDFRKSYFFFIPNGNSAAWNYRLYFPLTTSGRDYTIRNMQQAMELVNDMQRGKEGAPFAPVTPEDERDAIFKLYKKYWKGKRLSAP